MATGHDDDPWLRKALRHAPDADAEAPAAISASILRAARHAPAATPRWPTRLQGWWTALARPPVAAALASLTLGSVIVLMWRDGPPPDVQPEADPPHVAAAPARPMAPAAAEPGEAPPRAGDATTTAPAGKAEAPDPPRAVPAPRPPAAAAPRQSPVRTAPTEPPARAEARVDESARERAAAVARESGAQADLADRSGTPQPDAEARAAAESTGSLRRAARPGADGAPAIAGAPGAAAAPALSTAPARAAGPTAPPATAASTDAAPTQLLARLRAEPAGWRWSPPGGEPRAVDAAMLRLLDVLAAATPRWALAPAAPAVGTAVTFARDGEPPLVLHIDGTAIWLLRGGAAWRAPLDAGAAERLRAALPR